MENCTEKTPLLSQKSTSGTTAHVQRPVQQVDLNDLTRYQYRESGVGRAVKEKLSSCDPKSCLLSTVPILEWLPRYRWKNIPGDFASGLTVAIMHIPHGMAYALLGNLPPVAGIYMAFFPALVYVLLGTSRHVSMGTFALVCLMTGKVVSQYSHKGSAGNATLPNGDDVRYTPVQVATAVTFTVAAFQMLMYVFRLGIVTKLLSETLVNAFTCAAAFYVVISQLKDLFGLVVPKRTGIFSLVLTLYDIIISLPSANVAAVVMSALFITVLVINNEILKPILARKTKIPFPIELAAVVIGTGVSYGVGMKERYELNTIGHVPTGLPQPDLPPLALLPSIAMEAFVITMVSYTISMSLALIVAQRARYNVDANQELLALGFSNLCGSFFSCMPITASLSRTMIQYTVGGVTQLASVVSCVIILAVLLWIGPVFETLPKCVLASIIVVALKSMLLQFLSLRKYWVLSKWDGAVWLVTFFATTILSIDYGLLAGILISLFSMFVQGQRPDACLMGVVPGTDLYLDTRHHEGIEEVEGIKIFHYSGSLNFASNDAFKSMLFSLTGLDPFSMKIEEHSTKSIILDFPAVAYIDPSGVETLRSVIRQYTQLDVSVYICSCSDRVFEALKKCSDKSDQFAIFPTVHDAVLHSQSSFVERDV